MTETEVRMVLKTHGWTYKIRKPRGVASYIYAQRRKGKEMVERYMCPLSRLEKLTEEQLVTKLTAVTAKEEP